MGPEWLHEVKHDGWRAQLYRSAAGAFIFSRNGKDISGRFSPIRAALGDIPAYFIIDAEIVGCDADGVPDFHALTTANNHGCCAWCFDLMMIEGKDVRHEPLEKRRARLQQILREMGGGWRASAKTGIRYMVRLPRLRGFSTMRPRSLRHWAPATSSLRTAATVPTLAPVALAN